MLVFQLDLNNHIPINEGMDSLAMTQTPHGHQSKRRPIFVSVKLYSLLLNQFSVCDSAFYWSNLFQHLFTLRGKLYCLAVIGNRFFYDFEVVSLSSSNLIPPAQRKSYLVPLKDLWSVIKSWYLFSSHVKSKIAHLPVLTNLGLGLG